MCIRDSYDYSPDLLEGNWLATRWCGQRVLAMGDCLWGALDGINEAGLAASLSFGGKTQSAEGFGIPLVMRYLLEVSTTVEEACEVLKRVPAHMSYSITLLDANAHWATVYVGPDQATYVTVSYTHLDVYKRQGEDNGSYRKKHFRLAADVPPQ